jgi:hypothetical protein
MTSFGIGAHKIGGIFAIVARDICRRICTMTAIMSIICIILPLISGTGAFGASGSVAITRPANRVVYKSFSLSGTYSVTEDSTPNGSVQPMSELCLSLNLPPTWHCFSESRSPYSWNSDSGIGTYAYLFYSIDDVYKGSLGAVQLSSIGQWNQLGQTLPFTVSVDTSGFTSGSAHTVLIYLRDVWGLSCGGYSWCDFEQKGDIIASDSFSFVIGDYKDRPQGDRGANGDDDCSK